MHRLLIEWPLRMARRADNALRNKVAWFAALADGDTNVDGTDNRAADSETDESTDAKQKSEFLKRMAAAGF